MCALLAKLVRVEHVYATVFVDESIYEKTSKETDKRFDLDKEQHLRNLIRYIYHYSYISHKNYGYILIIIRLFLLRIVSLTGGKSPFDWDPLQREFIEKYRILYSGEPVPISPNSNGKFEAVIPPQLVLLDVSNCHLMSLRATMI